MSSYTVIDLENVLRRIGRGVVFYAHDGSDSAVGDPTRWDNASELFLAQLGDTEGDIVFTPNGSIATLTLPELSGDAIHEATYTGDNPTIEAPLFLADPDLLSIVSPTGLGHAGHFRTRDVDERTIVIFPEDLFRRVVSGELTHQELSFAGGTWTLGGDPLDAAHQTLLGNAVWIWRCYAERATRRYLGGHGDDGKNIESVMFHAMMHPDMPDGHQLFTIGNPYTYSIAVDGGS